MESNLKHSEAEAEHAQREKERYEHDLEAHKEDTKGLWLRQVGLVQGEAQQRRDLELQAYLQREESLAAFQQSADAAAAEMVARIAPHAPSPSEALQSMQRERGPTETPSQRLKESAVTIIASLELLTPLTLG